MSRTIIASGSLSCTDKAERPEVSTSIKSSCEHHRVFPAKRYQHDRSRPHSSLVEHRVEPGRPDIEGSADRPSAASLTRLLDSTRLRCFGFIGRLPPASLVYWIRLGFGVLAGVIYNLAGFGSLGVGLGTLSMITVGIGVYSVSVFLVKNLLGYGPEVLKGPNKHVTIGMGSYVIWMIFTTILLYTVLNPHPS